MDLFEKINEFFKEVLIDVIKDNLSAMLLDINEKVGTVAGEVGKTPSSWNADRKKLKNPNGLILGTPGSGKSFAAKREITNAFLITDDDIIIADPEAEVRHEVA